jgi:hypothetical protein
LLEDLAHMALDFGVVGDEHVETVLLGHLEILWRIESPLEQETRFSCNESKSVGESLGQRARFLEEKVNLSTAFSSLLIVSGLFGFPD